MRRLAACLCLLLSATALVAPAARASWDQERLAPGRAIEGYASQVSVRPGETLDLHVSTVPARRYRVDVHRVGWGDGSLEPPRLTCRPACDADVGGEPQPVPVPAESTGEVRAGWPVTDRFTVPSDWRSGYYVARLVLTTGPDAGKGRLVPFVVREPARHRSRILVEASVNTWQAYNDWGGKSLYLPQEAPATHVSFARPYRDMTSLGQGPFAWEVQLARFLERGGYDVSYTTNVDVHRDPSTLLGRRLVISAGHNEYWTSEQRDAYEAARDAGVNLAFFGANTAYWQVRYADGERTVVGYKKQPDPIGDPAKATTQFRLLDPPRPECELLGVQYQGGRTGAFAAGTLGALDHALAPGALDHRWVRGSGLNEISVVRSLVGYEWDGIVGGCVSAPLTTLFAWGEGTPLAHAVTYTATSGAQVFATGTMQWSWALDGYGRGAGRVDPRLQQVTRTMLDELSRRGSRGPRVSTGAASAIGDRRATVAGTVDARGIPATYWVEYGPTFDHGRRTPLLDGGAAMGGQPVSVPVSSALLPGTRYHYRIVAAWEDGASAYGADRTFTTTGERDHAGAILADGPVSYWRLNQGSGTSAHDTTNANKGRFVAPFALKAPGALSTDSAVRLSGGGHVGVPDAVRLRGVEALSVEAWVLGGTPGERQGVAAKGASWALVIDADGHLALEAAGAVVARSAAPVGDRGAWHHVAVAVEGTTARLYVDGSDVTGATEPRVLARSKAPLLLGAASGPADAFAGTLDEVALHPRALGPEAFARRVALRR